MAEYIEREALMRDARQTSQIVCGMADVYVIEFLVYDQPTADVVEVRHGRWKWGYGLGGQYGIWCTNCGAGWKDSPNAEWIALEHDYCGKCGADMRGEKNG